MSVIQLQTDLKYSYSTVGGEMFFNEINSTMLYFVGGFFVVVFIFSLKGD